jgi:hypothetical protein
VVSVVGLTAVILAASSDRPVHAKQGLVARHGHRGPPGHPASAIQPGEIVPGGVGPFFTTDDLGRVRYGWRAASHRHFTGVDAGVDPYHLSTGVLGVFRQDYVRVTQTGDLVRVAGAGALRITRAPLGRRVVTSAQRRGVLWFVGRLGVHGKLHLAGDTVTITHV